MANSRDFRWILTPVENLFWKKSKNLFQVKSDFTKELTSKFHRIIFVPSSQITFFFASCRRFTDDFCLLESVFAVRKKSFLVDTTAASNFGLQFLKKEGAVSQFVLESNKLPRSRLNSKSEEAWTAVLTSTDWPQSSATASASCSAAYLPSFSNKTNCLDC